jgi:hypothetical protein
LESVTVTRHRVDPQFDRAPAPGDGAWLYTGGTHHRVVVLDVVDGEAVIGVLTTSRAGPGSEAYAGLEVYKKCVVALDRVSVTNLQPFARASHSLIKRLYKQWSRVDGNARVRVQELQQALRVGAEDQ